MNWRKALYDPPSANAPTHRIFGNVEMRFNQKLAFNAFCNERDFESNMKSMDRLIQAMDNEL